MPSIPGIQSGSIRPDGRLAVGVRREHVDPAEDDRLAVTARAVLRGADEDASRREQPPGRAGAARVGHDRVLRMRPPRPVQRRRRVEPELSPVSGARDDVREQPQEAVLLDVQGGVDGGQPVEQHPIEPPAVGKLDGAVELDPARLARLGKHVDRAVVLEHERVREMVVALEHRPRRRPGAVGPGLADRDDRPPGGVGVVLDEQEVAAADLDRERVGEVAPRRVRQRAQRPPDSSVGRSLPHRDEPLLPPPRAAAPRDRAPHRGARRVGDRDRRRWQRRRWAGMGRVRGRATVAGEHQKAPQDEPRRLPCGRVPRPPERQRIGPRRGPRDHPSHGHRPGRRGRPPPRRRLRAAPRSGLGALAGRPSSMGTIAHTPRRGAGPSHAVRSAGTNDTTTSSGPSPAGVVRPAAIAVRSAVRMASAGPEGACVGPLVQAVRQAGRTPARWGARGARSRRARTRPSRRSARSSTPPTPAPSATRPGPPPAADRRLGYAPPGDPSSRSYPATSRGPPARSQPICSSNRRRAAAPSVAPRSGAASRPVMAAASAPAVMSDA